MKFNTVKLGEYLYIKGRIGWKGLKKKEYLDKSDFRIINGESLTENGIDWNKAGYISKERYDESPEIMLQPDDILISKDGTIGKIGYVDSLETPTTVASGIFVIRNQKPEIINTRFIYHFFCSKYFKNFIAMRTEGSVIPHLYQKDFVDLDFPLPQLSVQDKIVGILDAICNKIDLNKSINENLEQQAIAIFNELAQNSNSKKPLSEFIKIKHGYAFKGDYISTEDNGIVLVTPGNFCIGGGFKENKCKYFTGDYPNDYVLQPNSLIVTMTDLSKEADTLGYSALVPQSSERIYLHNQRIGLVEPINTDIPLSYVYWYMRSYEYHMSIVGSASGSTVKHTSPGRILEQHIPLPDKNSLEQYAAILDNINTIVSRNNAENTYLHSLREALLPKLMSGEISVDDAVF